jgi:hypothetical protein
MCDNLCLIGNRSLGGTFRNINPVIEFNPLIKNPHTNKFHPEDFTEHRLSHTDQALFSPYRLGTISIATATQHE